MLIANILATHAQPGTLVVDLTRPELGFNDELQLAPSFGASYRRSLDGARAERMVVVCELADLSFDIGRSAVQLVLFDELSDLHRTGTLERATQAGWMVAFVDATGQRKARFAMVLAPFDERALASQPHLRTVNEYRVRRLEQREQDQEIERAHRRIKQLETELASARRETSAMAERADRARELLVRARGSVGFRIGRATRVALRGAGASPWTAPVTWVRTFRGEDEILDSLEREPKK